VSWRPHRGGSDQHHPGRYRRRLAVAAQDLLEPALPPDLSRRSGGHRTECRRDRSDHGAVPRPWLAGGLIGLGGLWASEFEWAQRLLRPARGTLKAWTGWLIPRPWWVKGLVLLVTVAAVASFFWLLFLISGVPGYFPDIVAQRLKKVPGLGR